MIKIAICDDEQYFREKMRKHVADYMERTGLQYQIDEFNSGEEFINSGFEILQYAMVFLDINMDKMNGMTVAGKIREISKEIVIVFVTAFVNYTLEGYKYDAIRYLLKGTKNFTETVNECMDAIMEKINYKVVTNTFDFREGKREILLNRIIYIESKLHVLEFYVMENDMRIYSMYGTLNSLEKELEGMGFIRIHQSYLVNLKYIESVERFKVVLNTGMELSIPKARYKEVKDTFIVYRGEL